MFNFNLIKGKNKMSKKKRRKKKKKLNIQDLIKKWEKPEKSREPIPSLFSFENKKKKENKNKCRKKVENNE